MVAVACNAAMPNASVDMDAVFIHFILIKGNWV